MRDIKKAKQVKSDLVEFLRRSDVKGKVSIILHEHDIALQIALEEEPRRSGWEWENEYEGFPLLVKHPQ